MSKRIASIVLVTALGVGGVSSLALSPSLASAASGTLAAATGHGHFAEVLKGLVADKTLTQAQADKVEAALEAAKPKGGPGHGGPGHDGPGGRHHFKVHLDEVATLLGVTPAELRTALQAGKSLADVAATNNISKETLIAKLVTAAEARLAEKVKEGDLTQAQADARKADLKARITELVDRKGFPGRGHGDGANPSGVVSSGATSTT